MPQLWSLLVPSALAVFALRSGAIWAKMGVPLTCAIILATTAWRYPGPRKLVGYLVSAFVLSAIGDWFLSNKSGRESLFVLGIAFFFGAHLGYLGFAWSLGRLNRPALGVLLAAFVPFYVFWLRPAITSHVLEAAVLVYLLISCLVLAVAGGMRLAILPKTLYAVGIGLIVFSDTLISFNEFLDYNTLNRLILPTYYLAHLSISAAIIIWLSGDRGRGAETRMLTAETGDLTIVTGH